MNRVGKNSSNYDIFFFETNGIVNTEQRSLKQVLGPVHTDTDFFESATFSFWIRLSSTRIRRIRQRIRNFFESALQSGKKINTQRIRYRVDGRLRILSNTMT